MKQTNTRKLANCAMLAALYTALCLALAPLSFGAMQIRVAEALTLLPVFSAGAIWGVTLGCALSNLIGMLTGANMLGLPDLIFGTIATFLAAVLSYRLRKLRVRGLPVFSALPPILINAVIIGAELTVIFVGEFTLKAFAVNALFVALGQAVSCLGLGLPLVYILEKFKLADRIGLRD